MLLVGIVENNKFMIILLTQVNVCFTPQVLEIGKIPNKLIFNNPRSSIKPVSDYPIIFIICNLVNNGNKIPLCLTEAIARNRKCCLFIFVCNCSVP